MPAGNSSFLPPPSERKGRPARKQRPTSAPTPMAAPKPDFVDPRAGYFKLGGQTFTDQMSCESCGQQATHAFIAPTGVGAACESCGVKAMNKAEQNNDPVRLMPLTKRIVAALKVNAHAQRTEIRKSLEEGMEQARPGVLQGEGVGSIHPFDKDTRRINRKKPVVVPSGTRDAAPNRDELVRQEVIKRRPDWSQQLDAYIHDLKTNGIDEDARGAIEEVVNTNAKMVPSIMAHVAKNVNPDHEVEGSVVPLPMGGGGRSKLPGAREALSRRAIQEGRKGPQFRRPTKKK